MRCLITGCSGFVGRHLIRRILEEIPDVEVFGLDVVKPSEAFGARFMFLETNMMNSMDLVKGIHRSSPDWIIHLASFSSVGYSWEKPIESFKNNTNIFLNLLEAVHIFVPSCKILSVGSSEEYGIVTPADLPLCEEATLRPASPYAVARVAQENLSIVFAKGFGLKIVCTRSFNHVGPGQSAQFVVSAIGRQFVEIEKGIRDTLMVGDTTVVRDFLDVKDVIRAYLLILRKGEPGGIYNVCSGVGRSIADIIEAYRKITGLNPLLQVDPKLIRPVENPIVIGSAEKIRISLGWRPEVDFHVSLNSIIDYWRRNV